MHRHFTTVLLAFIAIGLVFASPVTAGEEDALREQVRKLEQKVEALSGQQSTQLEQTIESYLDESAAWKAAEAGDGMQNITITAAFTANLQATLDQNPSNRSIVSGDIDLGFHFQVTENLELHITGVAASGGGSASVVNLNPTLSGLVDGVGTNGNNSVTGFGRSFNIYEAYIVHGIKAGNSTLYVEMGAIDPRTRYLQNAFADNENTQFMNNLFDDSPSILWQTTAAGGGILGLNLWISFGQDDMHTFSTGYYNPAGQWWNKGQWFFQYALKMKVAGREMNARVMVMIDGNNPDASGSEPVEWGVSWDWWATEKIGVFVRIAGNTKDVNPVELDWSLGGEFHIVNNRPNDYFGAAIGQSVVNTTVMGAAAKDELVLELYYLFGLEEGKLQVTPYLQWVTDPGGVSTADDLWILGLRIHVPF